MYDQRKRNRSKSNRARNSSSESEGLGRHVICSLKGSALALLLSVILAFALCAFAYSSSDPDRLLTPLSLVAVYIPSIAAGFFAARSSGSEALICGLISGGGIMLTLMFVSLFFPNGMSASYPFAISLLLHALIIVFSVFGAYLGISSKRKRHKRR